MIPMLSLSGIRGPDRGKVLHCAFSATAVLLIAVLGAVGSPVPAASGTSSPMLVGSASIHSLGFPGPFVPEQVVSVAGEVWVLGESSPTTQESCSVAEVNPQTLRATTYPIPVCGYYVAVGDGVIYLAADEPAGYNDEMHLEVFNPATKRATVMNPVMITTQGSGRAHMDMAYEANSIWLSYWGSELVKVSTSTGAVLDRITNAPPSVGGHGTIVTNRGRLWIAEGASSPASIYRLSGTSRKLTNIYSGPARSSVLWLSSIGGRVWAAVQTYNRGQLLGSTRLLAFDSSGREVLKGPVEEFGDVPLVGSRQGLWSAGSGPICAAPQRLWKIDPATGRSTDVTTLRTPVEPCLTESPTTSEIAVVGKYVFVLEPTGTTTPAAVLYRIQETLHEPK